MNSGVTQAWAAILLAERDRGDTSACTSGRSASCLLLVKEESFVSARQARHFTEEGITREVRRPGWFRKEAMTTNS